MPVQDDFAFSVFGEELQAGGWFCPDGWGPPQVGDLHAAPRRPPSEPRTSCTHYPGAGILVLTSGCGRICLQPVSLAVARCSPR